LGLREHEKFGAFSLQTQVAWSKNVNEERDCPPQIILGANDHDFCCLIALAGYLETRFASSWGNARFLFGNRKADDEPSVLTQTMTMHSRRSGRRMSLKR
jgi:hypothetical protein